MHFVQQFVQPVDVTVESVNKTCCPPSPPPLYGVQQLSPVEYTLYQATQNAQEVRGLDRTPIHPSPLSFNISTCFVFYSVLEEDDGAIVGKQDVSVTKIVLRKYTL